MGTGHPAASYTAAPSITVNNKTSIAYVAFAAVLAAGALAALPHVDDHAEPESKGPEHRVAFGGIAVVAHRDADGSVLGTQAVHNRLLDAGEAYILRQVFMDGQSDADTAQIGAICLSADDTPIIEGLDAATFTANHEMDADTVAGGGGGTDSTIAASDTRECLTDADVDSSGQIATVGPLTFTANNTASPDASRSNWKPSVPIKMIGVCQGFAGASAESCTAPLFAAVDISDVTLNVDETLTVTYTFDMSSNST